MITNDWGHKDDLAKIVDTEVFVHVIEVRKVETDAQLVAENIAAQLVKRVSFRRAMKKAVTQAILMTASTLSVLALPYNGIYIGHRVFAKERSINIAFAFSDISS